MNEPKQKMRESTENGSTGRKKLEEHLLARGMNPSEYRVCLDEETQTATFLLFTLTGSLAGYQSYKPHSVKNTSEGRKSGFKPQDLKYFTYVSRDETKTQFSAAVFGMEKFDWRKPKLYVVEGVFDAVKLHNLGLNAVAVLCNNPKHLRPFFKALSMRVVGVLDNDPGGMALAKVCDEHFLCPEGRDPGDMTTDELKELLQL